MLRTKYVRTDPLPRNWRADECGVLALSPRSLDSKNGDVAGAVRRYAEQLGLDYTAAVNHFCDAVPAVRPYRDRLLEMGV